MLSISVFAFGAQYPAMIDPLDKIPAEVENELTLGINAIKETYDFNVTLAFVETKTEEEFDEYVDNFSDFDQDGQGACLLYCETEETYFFYSLSYGAYRDSFNEEVFEDFVAFDKQTESYEESFRGYLHFVEDFLEKYASKKEGNATQGQDTSPESLTPTATQAPEQEIEPQEFSIGIIDDAGLLNQYTQNNLTEKMLEIYETYNHRITFITKDFDYAGYYTDYSEYSADIIERANTQITSSGSVIFFGDAMFNEYVAFNVHFGEHAALLNHTYLLSNSCGEYLDGDNVPTTAYNMAMDAINTIETILAKATKTSIESYIGVGKTINGFDPIVDAGELFTPKEEDALFARVQTILNEYDFDVTLLTMQEVPNGTGLQSYLDWYEGIDPTRDGLIFGVSVAPGNREFWTSARKNASNILTEDAHTRIDDDVPVLLKAGDYYGAFNMHLDLVTEFLQCAKEGTPYKTPMDDVAFFVYIVAAPALLALLFGWMIVKFVFLRQMKTAVIKVEAKDFMEKDSLNLTVNSDTFTHETVTRRYDPPSSSSSGGGGRTSSSGYGGGRTGSGGSF